MQDKGQKGPKITNLRILQNKFPKFKNTNFGKRKHKETSLTLLRRATRTEMGERSRALGPKFGVDRLSENRQYSFLVDFLCIVFSCLTSSTCFCSFAPFRLLRRWRQSPSRSCLTCAHAPSARSCCAPFALHYRIQFHSKNGKWFRASSLL